MPHWRFIYLILLNRISSVVDWLIDEHRNFVRLHLQDALTVGPRSDAFIVVYSVASRLDFDEAAKLSENLRSLYPKKPLLLVGNKTDLVRQVSTTEAEKVIFAQWKYI